MMITRIKNTRHRKGMLLIMVVLLNTGLILVSANRSNATRISVEEIVVEEPLDSLKITAKDEEIYATKTFTKVEEPAEFPGGLDGWRTYLEENLKYPRKAEKRGTQGVVKLQLIVDREGVVSNILVLYDPGDGLADEAVRIIKKGPKWIPAKMNKRAVTYRFVQTITFALQ